MFPVYRAAAALAVASLALFALSAEAATPTRIPVKLFGQPCMLEGPLTQDVLKSVHSVSPEEICSPFGVERTPEETRAAVDKLKNVSGLPSALDRYREKLTRRLKAELAFLESLPQSKKAKSQVQLVEATKEYVFLAKRRELETLAKTLTTQTLDAVKKKELTGQLYDFYGESIDASPEDEFHRAIRTLNVQYICSFEESDESDSE
jgi:hypothetical protein